jgi:hypothetical protein
MFVSKEQHANEGLRCAESGVLATTPVMMRHYKRITLYCI